ncbi:hypothetical protein BJF79_13880 [Actinomadura sp. CNU-125]|nr:hypothetical protein [Actinomadura sp. CNU-125]OLT24427.1 hypothetical protein BJF79_13880 [Actinomadura sp. CNU-125]
MPPWPLYPSGPRGSTFEISPSVGPARNITAPGFTVRRVRRQIRKLPDAIAYTPGGTYTWAPVFSASWIACRSSVTPLPVAP